MDRFDFESKRQLLWDAELAEGIENVTVKMHSLTRKGAVLNCDERWEGEHSGYGKIIFDGEKYRLYYRGCGDNDGVCKFDSGAHGVWCVAYSYDGKSFIKPSLGIYEYEGSYDNNIVMMTEDRYIDNFAIMLDGNPSCLPDAKYKAVTGYKTPDGKRLGYYKSADGLHFEYVCDLPLRARFDSMNIPFYDETIGKYRLYFRGYHTLDESNKIEYEAEKHVRDIRLSLSDDFIEWTEPLLLDYGEDKLEIQLYTNNIMKYPRGDIYVGMPARYIDRTPDSVNYKYLPDSLGFRPAIVAKHGRCGTAITDTMLMVSRDGYNFKRTREAFFTAGIENGENWIYGDGYFAYGMIETESDFFGEPKELSLYVPHGFRARPISFERYTVRLDGFYSWRADFNEGEVITKPFTFKGDGLFVNFSTSALGYLRIRLLDENGEEIEGYDTGRLFGDSVDRPCDFDAPLSALVGKSLRMKITMKDCDLYSFIFE